MFNAYCDRLIYAIMHSGQQSVCVTLDNPKDFKTMEDALDFFGRV